MATSQENNMFDQDDEVFVVLRDDGYAWVGRYRVSVPEWVVITATHRVPIGANKIDNANVVEVTPPQRLAFPADRVYSVSQHFDREDSDPNQDLGV